MAVFAIKIILLLGLVFYSGGPLEAAWRALSAGEAPGEEAPDKVAEAIPPCLMAAQAGCDATRIIIPVRWPVDRAAALKNDPRQAKPRVLPPLPRVRGERQSDCRSLASAEDEHGGEQFRALKVSCMRLQQTAAEFFLTYRGSTQ